MASTSRLSSAINAALLNNKRRESWPDQSWPEIPVQFPDPFPTARSPEPDFTPLEDILGERPAPAASQVPARRPEPQLNLPTMSDVVNQMQQQTGGVLGAAQRGTGYLGKLLAQVRGSGPINTDLHLGGGSANPAPQHSGFSPTPQPLLVPATLAQIHARALRETTPPLLNRQTTDDLAAGAMREAGGRPITSQTLLSITNQPGNRIDELVGPLNASMAANGIISPSQQAAFLSQVAQETWGFTRLDENLNYTTAGGLLRTFPSHFAHIQEAQQYVRNPAAIANRVYASRMLNGDENSGDGYLYRGRGGIMLTGRQNYRTYGYENDPDALLDPGTGMEVGARYWRNNGLNRQTSSILNRSQFDNVTRTINGPRGHGAATRWNYYQRALRTVP